MNGSHQDASTSFSILIAPLCLLTCPSPWKTASSEVVHFVGVGDAERSLDFEAWGNVCGWGSGSLG